jgi:hypothetical protein
MVEQIVEVYASNNDYDGYKEAGTNQPKSLPKDKGFKNKKKGKRALIEDPQPTETTLFVRPYRSVEE